MHKLISLLLFLSLSALAMVGQAELHGQITGEYGAMPGVNIMIKGTDKGTITNLDGQYSIVVYLGDVLVISFIGMTTQRIEITEESFSQLSYDNGFISSLKTRDNKIYRHQRQKRPLKKKVSIPLYYQNPVLVEDYDSSIVEKEGVAFMNAKRNTKIVNQGKNDDYGQQIINQIEFNDSTNEFVFYYKKDEVKIHESFELNSTFSFDVVADLPDFQNSYSSGETENGRFVYRSPADNNSLAWGPQLTQLEHNGSPSDFYKGGNVVEQGQGNGGGLSSFQPKDFFVHGYRFKNSLEYGTYKNGSRIEAKYVNENNSGAMPGAKYNAHSINLRFKINKFNLMAFYATSKNQHNQQQANFAKTLHALYTTPPEFDNANSIESRTVFNQPNAYLTSSGNQRSYNSNQIENPYWFLATDLSKAQINRWGINASYNNKIKYKLYYDLALGVQNEDSENRSNNLSFSTPLNGTLSTITDSNLNINTKVALKIKYDLNTRYSFENYLRYFFNYNKYYYQKQINELGYSLPNILQTEDELELFEQINTRTTNEIVLGYEVDFPFPLYLNTSLNIYQSNNIKDVYYLPNAYLKYKYTDSHIYFLHRVPGYLYAQYSKSLSEYSFQNRPNHFNTINYNAADFRNYFENKSVYFSTELQPTVVDNFDAGLIIYTLFWDQISFSANYYYKNAKNVIFPSQNSDHLLVDNLASITTQGFDLKLDCKLEVFYRLSYKTSILFSHSKTNVNELYQSTQELPIAGFSDVHKSLIKNEEVGVLVGSKYLRNNEGLLVIGNDGYPLVDAKTGIIGNPNPDWVLNSNNSFSWKWFELNIDLEYKHGGDVWNGTKNVLNYHGVLNESAQSRQITNHVYEGVNLNGEANTIPVDFANPADDVNQFKYLRNGYTGVAEDAIEDASWFRIKYIKLRYSIKDDFLHKIRISKVELGIWAENVLLVTPFSGSEPESFLFGYEGTQGLHLFNSPATKRFGVNLSIVF